MYFRIDISILCDFSLLFAEDGEDRRDGRAAEGWGAYHLNTQAGLWAAAVFPVVLSAH